MVLVPRSGNKVSKLLSFVKLIKAQMKKFVMETDIFLKDANHYEQKLGRFLKYFMSFSMNMKTSSLNCNIYLTIITRQNGHLFIVKVEGSYSN
jgi:hypothetical protein